MDSIKDFAERYKNVSNSELLEILDHPSHYQPAALDAAKLEFRSRQLSETAIGEARSILSGKEKKNEKTELFKSKIRDTGNVLLDTINPIQETTASIEKIIRIISIIFLGSGLYRFVHNFGIILDTIKGHSDYTFLYTGYIFPILFTLVGSILFWMRKQTGWIILGFFSAVNVILSIVALYESVKWLSSKSQFLFFRPSPANDVIAVLFYSGMVYVMCKQNMRAIFNINKQKMQATIITGAALGAFFIFAMYFFF
ncbi:MAG: hypothetical protein ABI402_11645 [Ferruginibacter sp.]